MHAIDPKIGDDGSLRVVVETIRGSRHKYAWNDELRAFELRQTLASGLTWPYDFGFIPRTKGGDGDPLDILVLMDEPTFPGCVVPVQLLGAFEVEQNGERNDRFVGCLLASKETSLSTDGYATLSDLPQKLLGELETFLSVYSVQRGNEIRIKNRIQAPQALRLVNDSLA